MEEFMINKISPNPSFPKRGNNWKTLSIFPLWKTFSLFSPFGIGRIKEDLKNRCPCK